MGLPSRRSARLAHAQVPLAQQANLLGRVALGDHARDEVLVLLRLVGAGLGVEADDLVLAEKIATFPKIHILSFPKLHYFSSLMNLIV